MKQKTNTVIIEQINVSSNQSEDDLVEVENLLLKLCFINLTVMMHAFPGITFILFFAEKISRQSILEKQK